MEFTGPAYPSHLQKELPSRKKDDDGETRGLMIGPALPPHFQKSVSSERKDDDRASMIGPVLPPHLQKSSLGSKDDDDGMTCCTSHQSWQRETSLGSSDSDSDDEPNIIGPACPASVSRESSKSYQGGNERKSYNISRDSNETREGVSVGPVFEGPALPPDFHKKQAIQEMQKTSDRVLGPVLPPGMRKSCTEEGSSAVLEETQPEHELSDTDDSECEEFIGPVPVTDIESNTSYASREIERRSNKMKDNLLGKTAPVQAKRESWMLELPPERAKVFGLGPRKFSTSKSTAKQDRSWSETPGEDTSKVRDTKTEGTGDLTALALARRDKNMAKLVEKHHAGRSESLLEIHQKNRKRKMDQSSKPEERRPFDREVDLQTNRFDEAQKQSIIRKSRELNDRFSSGKVQKFL